MFFVLDAESCMLLNQYQSSGFPEIKERGMSEEGSKELTTVSLADKVKEKIKEMVVDLIPEEAWGKMVESEVNKFTGPRKVKDGYNNFKMIPSELEEMIHDELAARFMEVVKDEFTKPIYQSCYENGRTKIPEALCQVFKDNAGVFVEALFSNIMNEAMNAFRNQMHNAY